MPETAVESGSILVPNASSEPSQRISRNSLVSSSPISYSQSERSHSPSSAVSPQNNKSGTTTLSDNAQHHIGPDRQGSISSDGNSSSSLFKRRPGPTSQIQVRPGITVCQNCLTTTTPLWRRDENGAIMCNACGLFLKLHGRRRPISLKTDVIKSRNRSNRHNRNDGSGSSKKKSAMDIGSTTEDLAANPMDTQSSPSNGLSSNSKVAGLRIQPAIQPLNSQQSSHMQNISCSVQGLHDSKQHQLKQQQAQQAQASQQQQQAQSQQAHQQAQQQTQSQHQHKDQHPDEQLETQQHHYHQHPHHQPQSISGQQQQNSQQHQHPLTGPAHTLAHLGALQAMGPVQLVYPASPALSPYIGGPPPGMILNSPGIATISNSLLPARLTQQPLSPQILAQTGTGPFSISRHTPVRDAMSELLLPRSPENGERIPHLSQIPVAQFQKSQQFTPNTKTNSNGQIIDPAEENLKLSTRVRELEFVNDLLKSRVQDLEASEQQARLENEKLKRKLDSLDAFQNAGSNRYSNFKLETIDSEDINRESAILCLKDSLVKKGEIASVNKESSEASTSSRFAKKCSSDCITRQDAKRIKVSELL